VLTNSRSLREDDAAAVNREVFRGLVTAAEELGIDFVVASRSDSTLRGHYPLETDVLTDELRSANMPVDGVVLVPAFIDAGRVTVESVHWIAAEGGMIPVSHSEFAQDATFGYDHADLRDWIQQKTSGRIPREDVAAITLNEIRKGGPARTQEVLDVLSEAQPVVVDATTDEDLRVLVDAILNAEAVGKRFIYRTGPSFVRARCGQKACAPVQLSRLRKVFDDSAGDDRIRAKRGLVVVGSHVASTTRQLDKLRAAGGVMELELDAASTLNPETAADHISDIACRATELLLNDPENDVVVHTSRAVLRAAEGAEELAVSRAVSAALVRVVSEILSRVRPTFVLAKGGITASDLATNALGITKAWSLGTLLPGIVAIWAPASGPSLGIPYIVFAGNVGDAESLLTAVRTLRNL
jgi:uncharacterized protein YgbK (DUF1537 family)